MEHNPPHVEEYSGTGEVVNPKCFLCARGEKAGETGHGLAVPSLGMLDVTCPITEDEITSLISQLKETVQDMFSKPVTVSPKLEEIQKRVKASLTEQELRVLNSDPDTAEKATPEQIAEAERRALERLRGHWEKATPYLVHCPEHGRVFLSHEESMNQANAKWRCHCGAVAEFDDEHFDAWLEEDDIP